LEVLNYSVVLPPTVEFFYNDSCLISSILWLEHRADCEVYLPVVHYKKDPIFASTPIVVEGFPGVGVYDEIRHVAIEGYDFHPGAKRSLGIV
jgi:hypothetical protein